MKEEEIIKRYIGRSNQNWGGATPEWVEKEFRQALQSYKDWLWKEMEKEKIPVPIDCFCDVCVPAVNKNSVLSEIQSLIKPEKK